MSAIEPAKAAMTIAAARRWGIRALRAAGVDTAGLDVRRLLAAALELPEAQILARPECHLSAAHAAVFAAFIERRRGREPVSRILGRREIGRASWRERVA